MFSSRSSFLSNIPTVVKNLIAINLILWLATIALPGMFRSFGFDTDLTDILGMHYWASDKFKLSQLITYMFMHGGRYHIFFNMFGLYMFGSTLENFWGPKKFLMYYLITGFGAGIVQQIFWTVEYQPVISALDQAISQNSGEVLLSYQHILERFFRFSGLSGLTAPELIQLKSEFMNLPITVGASGSIFGLLLAFGWLFPEVRLMMLFIPVPIKARLFVTIYAVAELFLGVASFSGDSVAHFAHLGGMIFGLLLLYIWRKKGY